MKDFIVGKFGLILILLVAMLAGITGIVSAEWVLTNSLNSWDNGALRWENGNVQLWLNAMPQAFYHEIISTNQDEFNDDLVTDACGPSTSTEFAGTATIGLYHTDTVADNNAAGFQSTSGYALVSCDLDQSSGTNDSDTPNTTLFSCTTDNNDGIIDRCEISNQDSVIACSTGNCQDEIQTTISINLDTDCDGTLDTGFDSDVCLYWTAEKPPFVAPFWQGNLQARISDSGGDKTVNFVLFNPTALTMQEVTAFPSSLWLPITFLFFLALLITLFILRRMYSLTKI